MIRLLRLSPKHVLTSFGLLLACFGVSSLSAQTFTSTLPILQFGIEEAAVPEDEKAFVTLKISANQDGQINRSDGPDYHYDGFAGIELRGSSSLFFDKRGYAIELRTPSDEDLAFPLLGMPEEEDWVLHGPYSDKSLIRNAFTYNLAQSSSTYAPRSRFCVVVFNDDYRGIYLLVERIKRDKNRLDIKKLTVDDVEGLDVTGGYILKIDKTTAEDPNVESSFLLPLVSQGQGLRTRLVYHEPKPEEIIDEQKNYIQHWMEDFESRLAGPDFEDEQLGFRPLIDLNSWIDFFLLNEITRNVDGYRISTYMHKRRDDQGGKLHMGPIWDFNLALGNADYCDGSQTYGWAYEFNKVCPGDSYQVPFHYGRMLEDSIFSTKLAERWETFRANEWSDESLFRLFDSLATSISSETTSNFRRWQILGDYVWPNNYVETGYNDGLDYTRNWLVGRLRWLDEAIPKLAPEIDEDFYFGPASAKGTLSLKGFKRVEYPITLELFSTSGQSLLKRQLSGKEEAIDFSTTGIVFYQLQTRDGTFKSGKLFLN